MLAMSVRVRPCSALWFVSSDGRVTLIVSSSCATLIAAGHVCVQLALRALHLHRVAIDRRP